MSSALAAAEQRCGRHVADVFGVMTAYDQL